MRLLHRLKKGLG